MKSRAVVIESFEDQPHLVEVDVPVPSEADVVIRVHAASINAFDYKVADGRLKEVFDYQFPVTIGRDYAGVVEAVGSDVKRVAVGDPVFGYFTGMTLGRGAFADHVCVSEDACFVPKPTDLPFREASCLPLCGIVALRCVEAVQPTKGASVLIVGAPGGAGSYAVQLAAARGAHVIATGLPDDDEYLRDLGAAAVVDQRADIVEAVRSSHSEPLAGLIDFVSYRPAFNEHVALLADGGRAASTHNAASSDDLEPRGIVGTNVSSAPDPGLLERLGALASTGELRIPIRRVFSLDEAPLGLELLKNEHAQGKFAISVVESNEAP